MHSPKKTFEIVPANSLKDANAIACSLMTHVRRILATLPCHETKDDTDCSEAWKRKQHFAIEHAAAHTAAQPGHQVPNTPSVLPRSSLAFVLMSRFNSDSCQFCVYKFV